MSETAETEQTEPAAKPKKVKEKRAPRPLLLRLFGISPWGAFKLVLLCVIVGVVVMAAQFDPREQDVDVTSAVASAASAAWQGLSWAVRNFWRPALAGAIIVLPAWVLWRLASLPFRR